MRYLYITIILVALILPSCSNKKPQLPKTDSILVEPSEQKIDSYIDISTLVDFIENLSGSWSEPFVTLPSPKVSLLFIDSGKTVATVFVGSDWIAVRLPESKKIDLLNSLSISDREKLDNLLRPPSINKIQP